MAALATKTAELYPDICVPYRILLHLNACVVPARIQLSAVAPKGGGQRDLLCDGPPQSRVALEGKRVKRRGQRHRQRLSVSRRRCADLRAIDSVVDLPQ